LGKRVIILIEALKLTPKRLCLNAENSIIGHFRINSVNRGIFDMFQMSTRILKETEVLEWYIPTLKDPDCDLMDPRPICKDTR